MLRHHEHKLVVSGYDGGGDYWVRNMTMPELQALQSRYDHVVNLVADELRFRNAAGDQVLKPIRGTGMGPVCLDVLHALQLNAGTFMRPEDVAEEVGHGLLRTPNNVSRHVSLLRKVHQEPVESPWFFVTRRSRFGVMWPAERTFLRVEGRGAAIERQSA